ncbi:uncharacterized protein LOC129724340 isoform X4 [Wyeomyia smithii]|uniref:uncharacterized protein LOC129724340 isoform X4 n=1 Tax=Wyeomyia smithii TaxID=174621 RepID=UPI0024681AFE|nr:uncharacterized protein LOC129724340 isoform X4 [Wyeomyia smithii]
MGPKTIKKLTGETNANPEISALKTQAELLDTQELSDMVEFTETDGIDSTKKELKELSDRSATDSIFSGLLLMKLVNAEQLIKTSVTGKPCQRFAKARNPNGTMAYPAGEKICPKIFEFICSGGEICIQTPEVTNLRECGVGLNQ